MRSCIAISIGILAVVTLAGFHLASPDSGLNIPVSTSAGVTATIALGIDEPLGLLTTQQLGTTTTYSDGNYQIQIIETPSKTRTVLRVIARKLAGGPFRMNGFSITVRAPRGSIQGIWNPGADPSSGNVMVTDATHSVEDVSDANYGIPYIAAASANARNVVALGLSRQDFAVSIGGQPVGDNEYEFRLKALTARTAAIFDEGFYISTDTGLTWFDTAANYSDWVDAINKYEPFPVSSRAYEPLYDAWYWASDQVNDRLYMDTARLASEVGIGLYLADSGWDTDAGEYQKWLNGKTGDYAPPPDKFADLQATFDSMRSENNLGVDLWLQPFAVGRESTRYPATKNMHIQVPEHRYPAMGWQGLTNEPFALPLGRGLESVNLCPRMSSTQTYLKDLFTQVATTYKPEGYWLDFIDGMASFCTAPHKHDYTQFGEGFRKSLETIKNTILTYNPNAVVHFRARYANLNTKPFANVWQSGDSPADFDRMRLNSIRLRPFSKGVVFAADQMYWPEGTSEIQVSKFIMTSVMVGVPAFGPTLIYSPPSTLELLKAWVTFYRNNQMEIGAGKLSPFGQLQMPNHKIEGREHTYAYIRNLNFLEVNADTKNVFLMNATDGNRFRGRVRIPGGAAAYEVRVLNRYLVEEPNLMQAMSDRWGFLYLNIAVEQGGMVILTPKIETPVTIATGAF